MHTEDEKESLYEKAKNFIFPAKKVLDKAGQQGGSSTPAPSTDTSYLQRIVKERMAEKKNPLVEGVTKPLPRKTKPPVPVKK